MENNKFGDGNEKLEFRQIVLGHIQKILEISSHELRDSSRRVLSANFSQTIEQEDTRFSYIQAIENLAYVLLPYFDEQIMKKYRVYVYVLNSFDFELNIYFQKEIELIKENFEGDKIPRTYFLYKKIEYAKRLFIELNLLLKRVDYLKSAIYGEESNEEVIEEKEEDDE